MVQRAYDFDGGRVAIKDRYVDQRAVGQNQDLVKSDCAIRSRIIDAMCRLPSDAAVGRAGEIRGTDVWRTGRPVPNGINIVRVVGVGRDGLLIVEARRCGCIANESHGISPRESSIGRPADEHGRCVVRIRQRERYLIGDAVRRDCNPRVAGAIVGCQAAAVGKRGERRGPCASPIHRDAGHQTARSAVGPTVLLPDADDVAGIRWINRNKWLDRAVVEVDARLRWVTRLVKRTLRRDQRYAGRQGCAGPMELRLLRAAGRSQPKDGCEDS
jgi:hypothetical protein